MDARVILIAGPTASGKSSVALRLAAGLGGDIINADSMQVYRELEILTARPTAADMEGVPHRLYGTREGGQPYSVQHWLDDVAPLLAKVGGSGRAVIVVGGTGLYFSALTTGLSPIPEIDPMVRDKWRLAQQSLAAPALHERLAAVDPQAAAQLMPTDAQRIVRALEVIEGTGRSIHYWRCRQGRAVCPLSSVEPYLLLPPREQLHERINSRARNMIAAGALGEVAALLEKGYSPQMPVMKAIGVSELSAVLDGKSSLEDAGLRIAARTRRYAKRQYTWMRNQFADNWRTAGDGAEIERQFG